MPVPIEIIRRILLTLKVEALIRCQCVCKEWRSIIQHPHFKLSYRGQRRVLAAASCRSLDVTSITNNSLPIKTQFRITENRSLYDWWSGVWCSCNGLVLFSMGIHILLWNPSTRCCTKVLELGRLNNTTSPVDVLSGLCYVSSTGDYKVVLLFRFAVDRHTVMAASLKNKEWRKVLFPCYAHYAKDGVNFHNTLHWTTSIGLTWGPESNGSKWGPEKIIYFEAESDEFKELPTPELRGGGESAILGLGIMDGCLCMAREGKERGEIQVLVMKEYGEKKSWVRQFVISASASKLLSSCDCTITLYSSKCNTKVLICSYCYFSWEILVYDVKNNKLDNHFLDDEVEYYCAATICSYVQSIVSLHEFIWRDDQHKSPENEIVLVYFGKV